MVARLEFCTVARWKDGEMVAEKLFYDRWGFCAKSECCNASLAPQAGYRRIDLFHVTAGWGISLTDNEKTSGRA